MASKSTPRKRTPSRAGSSTQATKQPRPAATRTAARARTTATKAKKAATPAPADRPAAAPAGPVGPRRMIFWDVENTSGEADLVRVLDHLKIDRLAQPTELVAVGNWRSIGAKIARLLAHAGARLVHSAPAVGVRDWSDLWIAVAAGQSLGRAQAGDELEIVSDDRAFDAVADAAAAIGVTFKRISYRTLTGAIERAERPAAAAPLSRGQRRRAARRRAASRVPHVAAEAPAPAPPVPVAAPHPEDEAHTASQEQIRAALARLSGGDSSRWLTLDALANTLRAEGFTRPPGSPRLVTRLRRVKDVEVSPNGMVRLLNQPPPSEGAPAPSTDAEPAPEPPTSPRKRTRRRRSRGASVGAAGSAERVSAAAEGSSSEAFREPHQ